MPTINLASKYEKQLLQPWTKESVISGKYNTDYEWDGVQTIHILTATTQALNDYNRTLGSNRYGNWAELEDSKQDLTLFYDKSFAITVDRGNYTDQMMAKKTGTVTRAQIAEQVIPWFDKLALTTWAHNAGTKDGTTFASITKQNVVDMFAEAHKNFVNNNVPINPAKCFCFIPTTVYTKLLLNPEFISVEKLGEKNLTKGVVGKCMNFTCVEVPDSYFDATMTDPSGSAMADVTGVHALFVHKDSVIFAQKCRELRIHDNPPGLSGVLMEGRYRGDAFVLNTRNKGVLLYTA